eukprot:193078_1
MSGYNCNYHRYNKTSKTPQKEFNKQMIPFTPGLIIPSFSKNCQFAIVIAKEGPIDNVIEYCVVDNDVKMWREIPDNILLTCRMNISDVPDNERMIVWEKLTKKQRCHAMQCMCGIIHELRNKNDMQQNMI